MLVITLKIPLEFVWGQGRADEEEARLKNQFPHSPRTLTTSHKAPAIWPLATSPTPLPSLPSLSRRQSPSPRISAAPFPASGIRLPDAPSSLHTCHCSSVTLSETETSHLKYQPCSLSVPSLCSRFCPDTFPLSDGLVACRLGTL